MATAPATLATPATPSRRVTWFTLLGLVLVPATIVGLLLGGLWQPTGELDRVTAAIVNEDQPVTIDGQLVPLGRQMAAGLAEPDALDTVDGTTFDWVLTDAGDATAGLQDGRYAAMVTIPEGFSRAATSTAESGGTPERATIEVATAQGAGLLDPALTALLTSQAGRVLGEQLTTTYLENVYVGFAQMGTALRKADAGATALDDGTAKLASGTETLADGATDLSGGIDTLASGADQLASGTSRAAAGAAELSSGASDLASGTGKLAEGADDLASGTRKLAGGAKDLAGGAGEIAAGTKAAGDAAAATNEAVLALIRDLAAVGQAQAGCATDPVACQAALVAALGGLPTQAELTELATAAGTADAALNGRGGRPGLVAGTAGVADGAADLASGATRTAKGARTLADGAQQAADGADQLADGAGALASGSRKLAGGAAQLASGAAQAAAGSSTLASGAEKLAGGASELSAGSAGLAAGLGQMARGVPEVSDAQQRAAVVARPVTVAGDGPGTLGSQGIALFAALALWIGSIVTYLVLAPVPPDVLSSSRPSWRLVLRAALPGMAVGLGQAVVVAALLVGLLRDTGAAMAAFAGCCLLSAVAFAAVQQGLAGLIGSVGRYLAMTAAVGALVAGIATAVPGWMGTLAGLLPLGPAISGLRQLAQGHPPAAAQAALLVVWAVAGLGLALLAVARRRSVPAAQLQAAQLQAQEPTGSAALV